MKAYELLAERSAWCQHAFALRHFEDSTDNPDNLLVAQDKAATCWCPDGAIQKCYTTPEAYHTALERLRSTLIILGYSASIWSWADSLPFNKIGHVMLLRMLKEADV